MAIKVGDKLPEATFRIMGPDGAPKPATTAEVFGGKKVALFAVPGAYTGVCSKQHLPGIVQKYTEMKGKGFDAVAVTSTNDIFVLTQWGKDGGADGKVLMLADGSAAFSARISPAAETTSPTETACNQTAPGAVAFHEAGRKPKRSRSRRV